MNAEDFQAAFTKGQPFQVCVRGYVVGCDTRTAFHTRTVGTGGIKTAQTGEISVTAEVRIDSAEIRNFDTTLAGTSMRVEKHGGGTIRVPIEWIEMSERPQP